MAYLPSLCPKLLCGQCRRSKVPTRVLTGSSTPLTSIGSQDIQLILNIEARGHDKAQTGSEITPSDNASAVHAWSSWSERFVRIFPPLIVTQVDPCTLWNVGHWAGLVVFYLSWRHCSFPDLYLLWPDIGCEHFLDWFPLFLMVGGINPSESALLL